MTIHTKWMELLRTEASDAFFHGELTSAVDAGFIDGQIKLMKPESVRTWADFIYAKFTSTINRHFLQYGCKTVILAFDDKRYVPRAKAITQGKRREGVNIIDFSETDILPTDLPELWKESIMNPWFKHRVIDLICTNVPRLISPPNNCRFVVDWETTTEYLYTDSEVKATNIESRFTIGEADIKFTRWMRDLECPMLVEATDGDYIPIALGLKTAGYTRSVVILKAWNEQTGAEFVHVDAIHSFLVERFRRAGGRGELWWEVKLFILLLGLSGTDFTRNLPLISPQRIWGALPLVVRTFAMAGPTRVDMERGKRVVELLYSEAFPKHIDPFSRKSVWSQVQASKLGQRNKALIPTDARILCTLRNVNFLMEYWLAFEAPSQIEDFGFRISEDGATVEWDD